MKIHFKTLILLSLLTAGATQTHAAPGEKYPQTKTRVLSAREVASMSSAQRRYAINEIYARHGLLFGDLSLRKQFLGFRWYDPKPGQTMAQTRAKFTRLERQNVERLSLAREIVGAVKTKTATRGSYRSAYAGGRQSKSGERFPETRLVRLSRAQAASMSQSQIRYAINEMYARHGFASSNAIFKQFVGLDWYHPNPNIPIDGVRAMLSPIERANLDLLVANRS